MEKKILATVGIDGCRCNDDALRHWLIGNGYQWRYDCNGRLVWDMRGTTYCASYKYLPNKEALRIYAIPVGSGKTSY